MDPARWLRLADELVRRFAAAVRSAQLYAPTHPLVHRAFAGLADAITPLVADQPTLVIGIIGQEIVVGDVPLPRVADNFGEIIRRLQALGIERIAFDRGVTPEEIATLAFTVAHPERHAGEEATGATPADPLAALAGLPHVSVGRIHVGGAAETPAADMLTIRRLYGDAVDAASGLWDLAASEGQPDPHQARALVSSLAQAVARNRTALIALTALRRYDNYTFTHMVNVSILTMAQARSLGVDGALLREFGLAALMHDIGKVRTPADILNKPDGLDDRELGVMRRHVVDGAGILRRTPEMPALAPIVAFEHHLRLDGGGYPAGVTRTSLNLGTVLCSIADVYDAMRSQRAYQQAFPTDRIRAVLERNDGRQFDQHLVRRFSQLMGIYPPGSLVSLNTGEIAVVLQVHAPDPFRPRVRIVRDASGQPLSAPSEASLWDAGETGPSSIRAPLDPADYGIDPLAHL